MTSWKSPCSELLVLAFAQVSHWIHVCLTPALQGAQILAVSDRSVHSEGTIVGIVYQDVCVYII